MVSLKVLCLVTTLNFGEGLILGSGYGCTKVRTSLPSIIQEEHCVLTSTDEYNFSEAALLPSEANTFRQHCLVLTKIDTTL
jgi:hypothetical protein